MKGAFLHIPDTGANTGRRDESIRKSVSRRRGRAYMTIATGDCAAEEVVNALKSIARMGQNRYKNFVKTVIKDRTV